MKEKLDSQFFKNTSAFGKKKKKKILLLIYTNGSKKQKRELEQLPGNKHPL